MLPLCLQEYSFAPSSLRALARLTKLQTLVIDAFSAEWELPENDAAVNLLAQQFPGRLTALTKLSLHWEVLPVISSVSACVNLQDLHLRFWDGGLPELGPQDWDALARLTCLTKLYIDVDSDTVTKPLCSVLGKLEELRVVGVSSWCPSVLPKLQSLTHLTALYGDWADFADFAPRARTYSKEEVSCPHIRELGETGADIPYDAFPNLVHIGFVSVSWADLQIVSSHCTALQTLKIRHKAFDRCVARADSCANAVRLLAQLPHLTHLELPELKDCELLAFTSAAATVGPLKLRHLHVCGPLSVFALMQLQSVRGLKELVVHVSDTADVRGTFSVEAVRAWLVGLAMVPKVSLLLSLAEQRGVFDTARQWATQHKLPLPAILRMSVEYVVDSSEVVAGRPARSDFGADGGDSEDDGDYGYDSHSDGPPRFDRSSDYDAGDSGGHDGGDSGSDDGDDAGASGSDGDWDE